MCACVTVCACIHVCAYVCAVHALLCACLYMCVLVYACVYACVHMIDRADTGFKDQLGGDWLICDLGLNLVLFVEMGNK